MLIPAVTEVREVQIPLLSAMLLGGCAAKIVRMARIGNLDAGLGPTALFPVHLRRPVALGICAAEFSCGVALLVTAGGTGRGGAATAARLGTSVLFLVATCALIELRSSHPGMGCGCFGDLSTSPVSGRTLIRSALLAAAALGTLGLPPLHLLRPGAEAGRLLGILAVELVVIAALSPELGEALAGLGYSEPCELRRLPAVRTLAALRRSAQWRRRSGLITAEVPADIWRELCWRYVVFPARVGDRDAEVVFAVYLRPHRPAIHAALVDAVTSEVLDWPAVPARRRGFGRSAPAIPGAPAPPAGPGSVPAGPARPAGQVLRPAWPAPPGPDSERRPAPGLVASGLLAAPTDPGRGLPAIRAAPAPPGESGLPFSRDL